MSVVQVFSFKCRNSIFLWIVFRLGGSKKKSAMQRWLMWEWYTIVMRVKYRKWFLRPRDWLTVQTNVRKLPILPLALRCFPKDDVSWQWQMKWLRGTLMCTVGNESFHRSKLALTKGGESLTLMPPPHVVVEETWHHPEEK